MEIRDATGADAQAIAAIYNDAVEHTTAIWNETTVDAANRAAWIAQRHLAGYPVLVAVEAAEVLGYASFGAYRPFSGYRHTVEHSVYVDASQRGNGVGSALLLELCTRARALGMHVMVAGIDASNVGSIRLHERLGFQRVGMLPQVGAKFGTWLDLVFLQLILDERLAPQS